MSGTGKLFRIIDSACKLYTSGNNFLRCLKDAKLRSVSPGHVTAELLLQEEHANELGTLQGGMATTIIDFYTYLSVLTIAAGPHTVTSGVSVNLNVDFFAPIAIGQTILIDARTHKSGKRIAFCTCDLYEKETGRHCVRGKHIQYAIQKDDVFKDFKPEDFS